ncbi:KIF-binding protein-like [Temnothorax nylanderi]|uniref:KIF-binding protein-like n=1 Tax=Temnothorax nylanderi TaxID=102681 RepID=UPI003A8B5087
MLAFLKQIMEERQAILQLETVPAESTTSMNISENFLDILQLSFEIKYIDEDTELAKKKNKIKVSEEKMNVLYHNVVDVLTDQKFDDIVALSIAHCNIGLEYVTSTDTDDLNTAVRYLLRCLELLKEKIFDRKAILTYIGALNGLYFAKKKEEDAFKYLDLALVYYEGYMENYYSDPIHIPSLVGVKEEESNPRIILNTLHHTTLQELERLYLERGKDNQFGTYMPWYMHKRLNIRLTDMTSNKTKFDEKCLDMAFALFDLSRYFLANGDFVEAKSHIDIGDYVIHKFDEDIRSEEKKAPLDSNKSYNNALAVSARSWGFYGVSLLRFWLEEFSQNKEKSSEMQKKILKLVIESEDSDLMFSDLLKKELAYITTEIAEICILNFNDAKTVFVKTLKLLEKAREYFTVDTDIDSYIEITINIADTYKYFADFEEQRNEQIKLHKRRVKCLRL